MEKQRTGICNVMMRYPGFILLLFACGVVLRACQVAGKDDPAVATAFVPVSDGPRAADTLLLKTMAHTSQAWCRQKGLNTEVAVFVDLGLHSGAYRCWVVRLQDGSIRRKGLVTHGSGKNGLAIGERRYSNENGSLLSSLGRYKTGKAYYGQFGLAYKLHGLDAGNSNAYERAIVLHAHDCVPETASTEPICQSWGCPTVAQGFLKQLAAIIDASEKPLLLWVFDSGVQ